MTPATIELLETELRLNRIWLKKIASKEVLMRELQHAITIKKHEKKISPYGVIFSNGSEIEGHKRIPLTELETARSLADGEKSFVLYDNSKFMGIVVLPAAVRSELELVKLRENYNGSIIQRSAAGLIKIIERDEIFIQEHRVWQTKSSVGTILDKINRCVPKVNYETLINILNFAFHQLSPENIGATLIWCLQDPSTEELKTMQPAKDLRELNININDSQLLDLLRHILSKTDGATLIDAGGNLLGTEAHLVYSDMSKNIIAQTKGTRHTSARRFSYDLSKIIAFTVSEDGPVTVFSDGADIANLDIFSAALSALQIERDTPEAATSASTYLRKCSYCLKYIEIEELIIYGWKSDESVDCPVCSRQIYRSKCHQLEAYVIKKL